MIKASIRLQELRRKIYSKVKTEKDWKFWGLYCHLSKKEVLKEAYRLAKANSGAPGIDGKTFEEIETEGVDGFLEGIRQELGIIQRLPDPISLSESGSKSIGV